MASLRKAEQIIVEYFKSQVVNSMYDEEADWHTNFHFKKGKNSG